jgi:hypothetical protein
MAMARRSQPPQSSTSLSFLDILANTIGALLFIFMVMIVSTAGSSSGAHMRAELDALRERAAAQHLSGKNGGELLAEAAELERRRVALEVELDRLRNEGAEVTSEVRQLSGIGKLVLPVALTAGAGAGKVPSHVECHRGKLVLQPGNQVEEIGTAQADREGSAFRKRLAELATPEGLRTRCLVLWVFPGGEVTFAIARGLARERGVATGWEPAEAGWSVDSVRPAEPKGDPEAPRDDGAGGKKGDRP